MKKLFRVPRITAGVSYWGHIGLLKVGRRFDEWLEKKLEEGQYDDLSSLADYLADELNAAAGNKALRACRNTRRWFL